MPSFSSYTQNCNKIKDVEHSRRYDFWCKFCAHTYITGKVPSFITCLINYSDATKSDVTCFICHKCDAWICVTRLRRRYRNPSNFFLLKSHNALFNFICINERVGVCVLSCIIMYAFNPVLLSFSLFLNVKTDSSGAARVWNEKWCKIFITKRHYVPAKTINRNRSHWMPICCTFRTIWQKLIYSQWLLRLCARLRVPIHNKLL